MEAQLAAQRARIEQMEALLALRQDKVDRLSVRAGLHGILQLMEVEVGQLVAPGDELARVSDPTHLKAELKIPGDVGKRRSGWAARGGRHAERGNRG